MAESKAVKDLRQGKQGSKTEVRDTLEYVKNTYDWVGHGRDTIKNTRL